MEESYENWDDFVDAIKSNDWVAEARRQYDEVVARYTNPNGTKKLGWMKAPNGKPTKLTEEQWVWVRTPNFKKWFGDWEKAAEVYTIVDVQNAPFSNVSAAIEWVKGNGVIGVMTNEETRGKGEINVSVGSIREMLNPRQREKSVSAAAHFAALTKLREIIRESKVVESHPDYKKGADGKRSKENGINPDVQIDVLYGAIHFGDDVYRVKTRIKRYSQPSEPLKAYSYQVSEIEVLPGTLEEAKSHTLPTDKTSITGNKLLQRVLNVNGNLILEHSKVVDENGEPLVVYRGDNKNHTKYEWANVFHATNEDTAATYGEVVQSNFINAKNPLIVDADGAEWLSIDTPSELKSRFKDGEEMDDGRGFTISFDEMSMSIRDMAMFAKKAGYDALIVKNVQDSNEGEEIITDDIVTFSPSQIKSATDNIGTYSQRSDMRWSIGGISPHSVQRWSVSRLHSNKKNVQYTPKGDYYDRRANARGYGDGLASESVQRAITEIINGRREASAVRRIGLEIGCEPEREITEIAERNGCLISINDFNSLIASDYRKPDFAGGEHQVWKTKDGNSVIKLNGFFNTLERNEEPIDVFDRYAIHNQLFKNCQYELLGFIEIDRTP